MRPCSSATRYCGKHVLRQVIGHLGRGLEIDLFRFLDQRIDDVGLAPGFELLRARARRSRRGATRA